ncbi:MAG: ParB/RepB/Spo0J family partition protein [Candidatus Thiodiazotropha sp.]
MSLQSVTLSQLVPTKANPRKSFDAKAIEGLAASIRADGLLQNLVVRPAAGKGKRYTIISGERRYRALKLLETRGDLPDGFTVPVEVRKRLSKDEALRLSTVENLQRADLSPLEETAALTKLVHKGTAIEDVASKTGLSVTTIKRRLALHALCEQAQSALEEGCITLAQAEALSLGNEADQCCLLEQIERSHDPVTAACIRETLIDARPSVALAIFSLEHYTGTITTDLFAQNETSYFDDADQFYALQKQAVETLVKHHEQCAAWVEVTENWRVADWQYREAEEGEHGGVLINLSPTGAVEVCENLIKTRIDEDTAQDTANHPNAPVRPKASYSAPLRRYIAHHKSLAIQELLLSAKRKAREVAAVKAITGFEPHEALVALSKEPEHQPTYAVMERQARMFAQKLGLTLRDEQEGWKAFFMPLSQEAELYEAVKILSDHELDELHTLLTALSFGQEDCDILDCSGSFFNMLAQDLDADMKNHWTPDRAFLSRRTRDQLITIAKESGYADGRGSLHTYKKSELVEGLLHHFGNARLVEDPSPSQDKALNWMPEVMLFPAVDPDVRQEPEQDTDLPEATAEEEAEALPIAA